MEKIESSEVAKVLFNFAQLLQAPKSNSKTEEKWLFKRLNKGKPLTIKEALSLPDSQRGTLGELLTQYVMFLTMFNDLSFPPNFLSGSSETILGNQLLAYMHENQWPFPSQDAH